MGGEGVRKPVFFLAAQNLVFNTNAVQNYKRMFGPNRGPPTHQ